MEPNLKNGLGSYRKIRHINEAFLEGYKIQKLAIFKTDSVNYNFVIQLNNDAIDDTVSKYSLGMVVFTDKKFLPPNNKYLIWGMQPQTKQYGNFKYIIKSVQTPIKHMDSLHLFLYSREGYKGVIGNMIRLKNIQL